MYNNQNSECNKDNNLRADNLLEHVLCRKPKWQFTKPIINTGCRYSNWIKIFVHAFMKTKIFSSYLFYIYMTTDLHLDKKLSGTKFKIFKITKRKKKPPKQQTRVGWTWLEIKSLLALKIMHIYITSWKIWNMNGDSMNGVSITC